MKIVFVLIPLHPHCKWFNLQGFILGDFCALLTGAGKAAYRRLLKT